MNKVSNLWNHFCHSWKHHPIIQLTAFLVLTGTFTIIFSMVLFFGNLERILVSWGSNIEMNIYLQDEVAPTEVGQIKKGLISLGYFQKVEYINSEDAAQRFFKKMSNYVPEFADQEEFLQVVPASFLGILDKKISVKELETVSKKITGIAGIEGVSYGQEWIENFSVFLNSIKNIGMGISLILILGSFFVISFTVYSVIVRRKDEIEILKLFGATPRMIKVPFLFEGALMSAISATFALVLTYLILIMQNRLFVSEMSYLGLNDVFYYFQITQILGLILGSALIGAFCANVCLKRMHKSLQYSGDYE